MKTASVRIVGITEMSQSKPVPKSDKETYDEFFESKWHLQCHHDDSGQVYIPPLAIKEGLSSAAKYLKVSLPGGKGMTFQKLFESGIYCVDKVYIGKQVSDARPDKIFAFSNGKSGPRVWRTYPTFSSWSGTAVIHVLDQRISDRILSDHLVAFGQFIGIGRFRPENGGFYGRFKVESLDISEQ